MSWWRYAVWLHLIGQPDSVFAPFSACKVWQAQNSRLNKGRNKKQVFHTCPLSFCGRAPTGDGIFAGPFWLGNGGWDHAAGSSDIWTLWCSQTQILVILGHSWMLWSFVSTPSNTCFCVPSWVKMFTESFFNLDPAGIQLISCHGTVSTAPRRNHRHKSS